MSKKVKDLLIDDLVASINHQSPNSKIADAKRLIELVHKNHQKLQILFDKSAKEFKKELELNSNVAVYYDKVLHRAVNFDFSSEPLSFEGALLSNTRFSRKKAAIYLASTHVTAMKEVRLEKTFNNTVFFSVSAKLSNVLDISTQKKCDKLKLDFRLIKGPWDLFNNIKINNRRQKYYTHYIADIARKHGLEGIVYDSAQLNGKKCIVIFPENLKKDSLLSLFKDSPKILKKNKTLNRTQVQRKMKKK